jgi:Rrf2 family nitric oxide-sensitive transcriptional repressor
MISQTAEYALRAAVHLAEHFGTPQTNGQIADSMKIPPGYLCKVLQTMCRAHVVASQRGLGGGFLLAREPDRITILEVINAVDSIQRLDHCPLGRPAHAKRLCPLHQKLDMAVAVIEEAFGSCTLADLSDRGGGKTGRRQSKKG